MLISEAGIEADRFLPVGDATMAEQPPMDQTIWARDAEIRSSHPGHHGRLWVGVITALPFALAFWALVWFAIRWALRA